MASTSTLASFDSQHQDMIHDAQMDYYGKRLATCSSDKTIKIFDVIPKGAPVKTAELIGHEGPVWEVEWSNPKLGCFLASCSYDRRVIIWKEDKNEWTRFYEYLGHELSVNSISWAPQEYGLMLACASSDGYISILSWKDNDWQKVKFKAHESGVNTVSWAPSSIPSSLVIQSESSYRARLVSGGCDHQVKIWHQQPNMDWKEVEILSQHSDWVRDVAWAPNIGLPYSTIASCSQDGAVIIWTQSAEPNAKWTHKELPLKHGSDAPVVWRVSWSITGNILAVSGASNTVTLWKESVGEWQCISQIDDNEVS